MAGMICSAIVKVSLYIAETSMKLEGGYDNKNRPIAAFIRNVGGPEGVGRRSIALCRPGSSVEV